MITPPTFNHFGEQAVLLSWKPQIALAIGDDIRQLDRLMHRELSALFMETVPAYCSLTVFLHPWVDKEDFIRKTQVLYKQKQAQEKEHKTVVWQIPVCYDTSLGWDLEAFAKAKSMTTEEVISLHTQETYEVYFLGFLPGFPYLGGLNERLHLPRKTKPSIKVPAGAVAIGGQQTGVYPVESPGGWHILGQTPIPFFLPGQSPPSFLEAGHQIRFSAISLEAYRDIKARSESAFMLPKKWNHK